MTVRNPADTLGKVSGQARELQKEQEKAKLREACQQFEAMFLKQMMSGMRRTVDKGGLLDGGRGEEIFTDMLDGARAEKLSQSGGIGLGESLYRQLNREYFSRTSDAARDALQAPAELEGGFRAADLAAIKNSYTAAAYGSGGSLLQLPLHGVLTSAFGLRTHPISGEEAEHHGVDIAADSGAPIMAAAGGTVSFAGENGGYGLMVEIVHPDGASTVYAHCRELLVKAGDQVKAGQEIAAVGSTGRSTGPHLHFEYRQSGGSPVDPLPLMADSLSITRA